MNATLDLLALLIVLACAWQATRLLRPSRPAARKPGSACAGCSGCHPARQTKLDSNCHDT